MFLFGGFKRVSEFPCSGMLHRGIYGITFGLPLLDEFPLGEVWSLVNIDGIIPPLWFV